MSWIDYRIAESQNRLLVTVFGKPTLIDYLQIVDSIQDDPKYRRDLDRICDFSQSEKATLSTIEILRFVARLRKFPVESYARTALVSDRGPSWIFLSMLVSLVSSGTYKLFEDTERAITWLDLSRCGNG